MEAWSDREEDFLRKLSYQSNLYYQYYNKQYYNLSNTSRKYNIPILVISSVNSLMAISLSQFIPQTFVSIANAILSATTGILGSIQLFLKINEKMSRCLIASIDFNHLYLKITKELSIDRCIRMSDGKTFLNECFNEYNQILEKAIPLEKKINNLLSPEDFNKLKLKNNMFSLSSLSIKTPESQKNSDESSITTGSDDFIL